MPSPPAALPHVNAITLVDSFEIPAIGDLKRYILMFRADPDLYHRRMKEYSDELSQARHYECSLSLKQVTGVESKHIGVLLLPKVKRNFAGIPIAETVYLLIASNSTIELGKGLSVNNLSIINELAGEPDIAHLNKLASLQ